MQQSSADIFLSYTRDDAARARAFADGLQAAGFSVWWDVTLRSGEAYDEVTERALRSARAVVVLWSQKSVASRWVRAEATLADRNRTLVPAMIEPCERPIMFELTHTADLAHWQGDCADPAWLAFLEDVRSFVGGPHGSIAPSRLATAESASVRPTVLVLPFINRSGEAEQEFFSDGMSEDIIVELGRMEGLDVVSRNTAFTLKGKVATSAELARTLHVSHILEGSVRKVGTRVRITAQLLDAGTDSAMWTERYDRELDDIFALQDEISLEVARALQLTLRVRDRRPLDQRETTSGEAYELFLLAREFERTGSERVKPAIVRLCKRAVQLDPSFARAWALMAQASIELVQRSIPGFSREQALADAQRGVELRPDLPETLAALADVLLRSSAFDAAIAPTQEALALDPNCYEANVTAGFIGIGLKRYEESVRHFEKAIELDPDAFRAAGMVGQAYEALGDREAVLRAARRASEICGRILAREPDHGGALGFQVTALVELGEFDRARHLAKRAEILDPDNARLIYNLACAFASVDADFACDLLEQIADRINSGWSRWLGVDNSLDPLRSHPRFIALMDIFRKRFGNVDEVERED